MLSQAYSNIWGQKEPMLTPSTSIAKSFLCTANIFPKGWLGFHLLDWDNSLVITEFCSKIKVCLSPNPTPPFLLYSINEVENCLLKEGLVESKPIFGFIWHKIEEIQMQSIFILANCLNHTTEEFVFIIQKGAEWKVKWHCSYICIHVLSYMHALVDFPTCLRNSSLS